MKSLSLLAGRTVKLKEYNIELEGSKMLLVSGSHFFIHFCFVALRPKSTAMVMAGWSVYLTTLFPGQA